MKKSYEKQKLKNRKLRWMRLDNAAKIYPAARRQNWSNVYRVSVTFKEDIDKNILESAIKKTYVRFPSICARLKKGLFWYYLEELSLPPEIMQENSYPLTRMDKKETRKSAVRIIAYKKRLAVEIFHSLTDGNGAMVFLKTLAAEYLVQKYDVKIPDEFGILSRDDKPDESEFEDSFLKYKGNVKASRKESIAWRLGGDNEPAGFLNNTCFKIPISALKEKVKEKNASVTQYLCAVMMMALQNLQKERVKNVLKRKPIKVLVPVNLRKLLKSNTLRNFVYYTTPEMETRLGEYDFDEILKIIKCKMGQDITQKQMIKKITTNVQSEETLIVKLMPLFIKNIVMKAIFDAVGERTACLSLSNLGKIEVPESMQEFIERFDFILGVQATAPYNCGVLSFNDTVYINFIRNIKQPYLEKAFHDCLMDMGIVATVESNRIGE